MTYSGTGWRLHLGDARQVLRALPDEAVDCVVTSPPYWGLRDYGVDGQIGLEPTPEAFLDELVVVFGEVRRILRSDGVLWLNMGDSYAADAGEKLRGRWSRRPTGKHTVPTCAPNRKRPAGLKPKDLVGMPWRLALALQADGWWLRADCVWHKPTVTPESVRDRPTRDHDYVFLLSKSRRYWYDDLAVMEPTTGGAHSPHSRGAGGAGKPGAGKNNPSFSSAVHRTVDFRNLRSVWTIQSVSSGSTHSAAFPPALARRCILAGCPAGGVVLDPFAGTATAGAVALELDREFIGIELSPEYCDIARDRLVAALERAGRALPTETIDRPVQLGLLGGS